MPERSRAAGPQGGARVLPVAVIPVAGVGSRLRPHTHTVPKALINVAGKPMLAHILDELDHLGIHEVTLVVGHMGDRIRHFVAKSYGQFEVRYVEQLDRQGLGHAVYLTRGFVPGRPLLIVLGDTIFRADFGGVIASPTSLLGVQEVEDPRRFGIVEVGPGRPLSGFFREIGVSTVSIMKLRGAEKALRELAGLQEPAR